MSDDAVVCRGGSNGTAFFSSFWSSGRCGGRAYDVRILTRSPQKFPPAVPPLQVIEDTTQGSVTYPSGPTTAFCYDRAAEAVAGASSMWISAPVNAYQAIIRAVWPAVVQEGRDRLARGLTPFSLVVLYGQVAAPPAPALTALPA